MKFPVHYVHSLRSLLRRANACRRAARPAVPSFRPSLEQLESRWVPCVAPCGAAAGCVTGAADHAGCVSNTSNCSNFNCTSGWNGNCPGDGNHLTCGGQHGGTPGGCTSGASGGSTGGCGGHHGGTPNGSCGDHQGGTPGGDCGGHQGGTPNGGCGGHHHGHRPPSSNDSLSGSVLDEISNTGQSNVLVTLTGTNVLGKQVDLTALTSSNGSYSFTGLMPGTYTLTETPPGPWQNDVPNNQIGSVGGSASTNVFSGIVLQGNESGSSYNFENIMLFLA